MDKATANIYLDNLRPKKSGLCSVKIKITYNRERKYYSTGIDLNPSEFEVIMYGKRKTPEQRAWYTKLSSIQSKAEKVIEDLPVFTFDGFEDGFFEMRDAKNSVEKAFDNYIDELRAEKRIGTAVSYECAKNSIEAFKSRVSFADINPKFLKSYHKWMLDNGKCVTTVGIYLRSLRTIYNLQKIDPKLYPFGEGKHKYSIPTGKNIKKALTVNEVAMIYNYQAKPGSVQEMAKDYWLFLYLCNGMNVKDFCLLKWSNIVGDMLEYQRAKTVRSKKESKPISVAIKPETWEIIKKWGQPSLSKSAFIFQHLEPGMDAERERAIYQQLTKTINKHMKRIVKELGIEKNVTTYFARHSFATVMKRSGAQIELISELLGHSSVNVTTSYLDSFEKEQIQEKTNALTTGFHKEAI